MERSDWYKPTVPEMVHTTGVSKNSRVIDRLLLTLIFLHQSQLKGNPPKHLWRNRLGESNQRRGERYRVLLPSRRQVLLPPGHRPRGKIGCSCLGQISKESSTMVHWKPEVLWLTMAPISLSVRFEGGSPGPDPSEHSRCGAC